MNNAVRGRVLYVTPERVVLAKGSSLYESTDTGISWSLLASLPADVKARWLLKSRFSRRLFRLGVHHLAYEKSGSLLIANKNSYLLNDGEVKSLGALQGSRPMALCQFSGSMYYGEYRPNPERSPVNIWRWRGAEWESAWSFDDVRHIHGVYHDSYEDSLWVTTGDEDEESAIWRTDDNFDSVEKVVGGSQQLRAVQLLFTADHVYFGSDAPDEKNYIYRMDRLGSNIEQLCAVGSSVFYGCQVGDSLFFSTAVEPSLVNHTRDAQVWGSPNGDDWQLVRSFRKDRLSQKYFQYGQVLFPAGEGDDQHLWLTPMATEHDQKTFKIPLKKIFK